MTPQSLLCRLGLHRWKPIERYSDKPVMAVLDGWLPLPFFTHWVPTYREVCTRCGKRRAV